MNHRELIDNWNRMDNAAMDVGLILAAAAATADEIDSLRQRAEAAEKERNALKWEDDGFCANCGEDAVRVSIDTAGYPHEVYAVRYCPVCHKAWVREEPVNPDAAQM